MKKQKHIIWTNDPYEMDYDNWIAAIKEDNPDLSDDECYQIAAEENGYYLDDERANLDINLGSPILVLADLGLWNGRRKAYKVIGSGNIKDCFSDNSDYLTWYVDELGDLRCDATHHDGTNHYLYRAIKSNERTAISACCNSKATRSDITRHTWRIGDTIAKVYGWKVRGVK